MKLTIRINWVSIVTIMILSIVLALCIELTIGPNLLPLVETNINFDDLVGILLAITAMLIAIVGLFIAALAYYGYQNLEELTKKKATAQVEKMLGKNKKGNDRELRRELKAVIEEFARKEAQATVGNMLADSEVGIAVLKEWGNIDSEYGEENDN